MIYSIASKKVFELYSGNKTNVRYERYEVRLDFVAIKFSGVAAVLPVAFFFISLVFMKRTLNTAADSPTKFILVLGKISPFFSIQQNKK